MGHESFDAYELYSMLFIGYCCVGAVCRYFVCSIYIMEKTMFNKIAVFVLFFRCGKLQCDIEFSTSPLPKYSGTSYSISFSGGLKCVSYSAISLSTDTTLDLAYVRDGTLCDTDKFCLNRQCVDISLMPGVCPG